MFKRKHLSGRGHLFFFGKPRSKELAQQAFFIV